MVGFFKVKVLKIVKLGLFSVFIPILYIHLTNGKNSDHYLK